MTRSRLLTAIAAAALACLSVTAGADVPTPAVTRVPGGTPGSADRNYPFFATDIVLANYGYVEEEFFYEGRANTYTTPSFGMNAEVASSNHPYRTRFLVRRPARASRFNGVVIVEWLNVTNQYDTDVLWLYQKEFFIREGYAWVGVSAQNTGLSNATTGLKAWSPSRYGTLDVTNGGTIAGDALAADIYSQAAAAIRRVPAVLGGLTPRLVIAAGQSQSASRLGPYLNAVHARDPIYDAAFLTVSNQAIRTDLTIPVIKVLSETERNASASEPDLPKVRVWTVAGSTHSEQYSLLSRAAFLQRDLKLQVVDACETPARSRVEIRYVYNAAVDALVKWKTRSIEPPHAPGLEFDAALVAAARSAAPPPATAGPPPTGGAAAGRGGRAGGGGRGGASEIVKRDAHGLVLGGIRLAEIAVPVAKESAELCGLGGTHVPFDTETLKALYPTHDAYVSKVTKVSDDLVKAGFLLPADAAQTIDKAKRSIYGLGLTCGPLCADVRQFPSNPSSMLLANQTAYLMIKGGDALVKTMDRVTKALAEGYTLGDTEKGKARFAAAAAMMDSFIAETRALRRRGNMPPETEKLLVDQGSTLQQLIRSKS